jgi:hypothetical protein
MNSVISSAYIVIQKGQLYGNMSGYIIDVYEYKFYVFYPVICHSEWEYL